MPKTKNISIETNDEIRINHGRTKTIIHIDEPDINELLQGINNEDITDYVQWNNFKPRDLFSEEQLQDWANENGYIKE
jgi:hypothetical protein